MKLQPSHVIDPLTPAEIRRAAGAARSWTGFTPTTRFVSVSVAEPVREGDEATDRAAEVVLHDPATRRTFELRVELDHEIADCTRDVDGVQPQMTTDEFLAVEEAVRRAPEFVKLQIQKKPYS